MTIEILKAYITDRIKTLKSNQGTDDWDESNIARIRTYEDVLRKIEEK